MNGINQQSDQPIFAIDILITELESAIKVLKECRVEKATKTLIDATIQKCESSIRRVRQAERDNALLNKRTPAGGLRLDGYDL